jgi:hypothetical protein
MKVSSTIGWGSGGYPPGWHSLNTTQEAGR